MLSNSWASWKMDHSRLLSQLCALCQAAQSLGLSRGQIFGRDLGDQRGGASGERILVGGDGHSGLLVFFNIPDDVPAVSLVLTADDLDMGNIHGDPAFPGR